MRRRWILTIAGAIALIVVVRIAVNAANGPSSPPVVPIPGASGSAAVGSKHHCDEALSRGFRHRSLSGWERRSLQPTIDAVCKALPGGTRLEVAAREVLRIVRRQGSGP
jgi:hypothetical protein